MAPLKTRCTCKTHGCFLGRLGYTEVTRTAQQKHLDDDLQSALQGLSLNETQPVSGLGTESIINASRSYIEDQEALGQHLDTAEDDDEVILNLKSIFEEFQE